MDLDRLVAVAGTVASLAGLLLAAAQTIRLRDLKRRTAADIWQAIGDDLSLIDSLEKSKLLNQNEGVSAAYKGATNLYRHLLRLAILEEHPFDEETIERWRAAGKLATDWQVAQARRFLETKDIRNKKKGAKEGS
jgi:hypothetical protein